LEGRSFAGDIAWAVSVDSSEEWVSTWEWLPVPLCPLSSTLWNGMLSAATREVARDWALPYTNLRFRCVNGWQYFSQVPLEDAGEARERRKRLERLLTGKTRFLPHMWTGTYLPAIVEDQRRILERARDFGDPLDFLRDIVATFERHWWIHFEVTSAPATVLGVLRTLCAEAGFDDPLAVASMLGWSGRSPGEPDLELDALAVAAAGAPAVARALLDDRRVLKPDELARLPGGRAFAERFAAFVDRYGLRCADGDLADPTWAEEPGFVLGLIAARVRRAGVPRAERRPTGAAEAAVRPSDVASRLGPAAGRRFRTYLEVARSTSHLLEDHNLYIDGFSKGMMRRALLALGRRLAADGALAGAEQVFYLEADELLALAMGAEGLDLSQAAESRRRVRERAGSVRPPVSIKAGRAGSPGRARERRGAGCTAWPLTGLGASPGVALGTARVVRRLEDVGRVRPGDIVVCPTMTPGWTHLLFTVQGLVCEGGGVLSHAAVVARERGVPAVVGVDGAASLIHDGWLLRVDGSKGTVERVQPGGGRLGAGA